MNSAFPVLEEDDYFQFPPVESATKEGIVAVGGNLSPGMLLSAYRQGIFPWFSGDEPILWWSPDPRFVLFPEKLHISKTMKKFLKKKPFTYTFDCKFAEVMRRCAGVKRPKQRGTWITKAMIDGYCRLHELGYAHSVEVYEDGELAGGLYGVSLGSIFFGESMFSLKPNASKAALIMLVGRLSQAGFSLVDSQVYTEHLASMGAEEVPREVYLELLSRALERPTLKGSWARSFIH